MKLLKNIILKNSKINKHIRNVAFKFIFHFILLHI